MKEAHIKARKLASKTESIRCFRPSKMNFQATDKIEIIRTPLHLHHHHCYEEYLMMKLRVKVTISETEWNFKWTNETFVNFCVTLKLLNDV